VGTRHDVTNSIGEQPVPKITTLGDASAKREFGYTGNLEGGVLIEPGDGRQIVIGKRDMRVVLAYIAGRTEAEPYVFLGMPRDGEAPPGTLAEWLVDTGREMVGAPIRADDVPMIGAVLVDLGLARSVVDETDIRIFLTPTARDLAMAKSMRVDRKTRVLRPPGGGAPPA
jgi:hypothetical protein